MGSSGLTSLVVGSLAMLLYESPLFLLAYLLVTRGYGLRLEGGRVNRITWKLLCLVLPPMLWGAIAYDAVIQRSGLESGSKPASIASVGVTIWLLLITMIWSDGLAVAIPGGDGLLGIFFFVGGFTHLFGLPILQLFLPRPQKLQSEPT